jgi:hypothetical protein
VDDHRRSAHTRGNGDDQTSPNGIRVYEVGPVSANRTARAQSRTDDLDDAAGSVVGMKPKTRIDLGNRHYLDPLP